MPASNSRGGLRIVGADALRSALTAVPRRERRSGRVLCVRRSQIPGWFNIYCHLLVDDKPCHELGTDYLAGTDQPDSRRRRLVAQLEPFGYVLLITPAVTARLTHQPASQKLRRTPVASCAS